MSSVTLDGGDDDDGSGGNTSGDKLLRTCLIWVEEGADDSTETDDLVHTRAVISLGEGRMKAGVELEEIASPTRPCAASDEEPTLEGR
jgi:hypothetical protein